jgi:hypothetical protein
MTVTRNIPKASSMCSCGKFQWTNHAIERKQERDISLDPSEVSIEYVLSLPYYTNNGCFHYCDSKEGITYYVRGKEIVTIIKRNPIAMARRICEIKGWEFNSLCRDHLFGNCKRGNKCKFQHKTL